MFELFLLVAVSISLTMTLCLVDSCSHFLNFSFWSFCRVESTSLRLLRKVEQNESEQKLLLTWRNLLALCIILTFTCSWFMLDRASRKVAARYNEVEQRKERASRLDRMVEHLSLKRALMVRRCVFQKMKHCAYLRV